MRTLYHERRDTAIAEYGGRCLVCKSTAIDNLQIVPKRGYRWSQEAGLPRPIRAGREKLRWLDQNGFPDSFTVVCGPTFSACRKALQLIDS